MWINYFLNEPLHIVPILCKTDIAGLMKDCSNFIANALELLQSYIKPSISILYIIPLRHIMYIYYNWWK